MGGNLTGAGAFPQSGLTAFEKLSVLVHHQNDEVVVFPEAIVDGPLQRIPAAR